MARFELPDLAGRRYLVTGGTSGLGYFTAKRLVDRGAEVVITGRTRARLDAAVGAIGRRGQVTGLPFDIAELDEVESASSSLVEEIRNGDARFDGVVLNAGVVHPPQQREETRGGVERVFATNILGHYALFARLLGGRALVDDASVVWLGSLSPYFSPARLTDMQLRGGYVSWDAYAQSKLAAQALAVEGDRRAKAAGSSVRVLVAHPGYSTGGLTPTVPGVHEPKLGKRVLDSLLIWAAQGKDRGAECQFRALTDPALRGGEAVVPALLTRGEPVVSRVHWRSYGAELGARLWDYCAEVAGVSPAFAD